MQSMVPCDGSQSRSCFWARPYTVHVIEALTGKRLSQDEAAEHPMAKWGPRACRATGTEYEAQRKAAEAEYLGIIEALNTQLESTAFALGDRRRVAAGRQ